MVCVIVKATRYHASLESLGQSRPQLLEARLCSINKCLARLLKLTTTYYKITATSFFLPHQNLAKSHHLSSGAKDSKPLKYKNTDIREQNIYNYD